MLLGSVRRFTGLGDRMRLKTDVVDFLRGEKKPMCRQALCAAIVREASHNAAWEKASYAEWDQAIGEAVKDGLLTVSGEVVSVAVKPSCDHWGQLDLF
jgi:hypothetical protein